MTSLCAIIPAANLLAANTALEEQGFGPKNFGVVSYSNGAATHAALHAWRDPAFAAAVKAIPGVVFDESEGDPADRTRVLIESQGARWGNDAPDYGGVLQAGHLYRYEDDSLWWCIQQFDTAVYSGHPSEYPAMIRRARRPGVVEPWVQTIDQHDAYRLLNSFTGQPDEAKHGGHDWIVSLGDGTGLNIWEPGVYGWVRKDGTPVPEPEPEIIAWAVGQVVAIGDLRAHDGKTWKAKVAHTTHAGWEPSAAAWAVWEDVA